MQKRDTLCGAMKESLLDEVLKSLYPGKGMRACDVQLDFPHFSEEDIGKVLDELVRCGRAESYEQGEQKFYLLIEYHAAARAIAS